jgi:POT family proton-dependent oligopeptide transporter
LIAFAILVLFSILYWAVYFQQFFSVSLCTSRVTNLTLPESSLTAFESLGVILFGPLVNMFWLWLQNRNKDFSIPAKFSLSFLFNGLSFLVLVIGWFILVLN